METSKFLSRDGISKIGNDSELYPTLERLTIANRNDAFAQITSKECAIFAGLSFGRSVKDSGRLTKG